MSIERETLSSRSIQMAKRKKANEEAVSLRESNHEKNKE